MNPRWSEYLPPPLFVSSNMKFPALENTLRIAFGFVLVALMVSSPLLHVAVWMATLSGAAGGPGVSVIVVVRVRSNHFAVIVTVVFALTADVVIGNALVDLPWLTTLSAGTWTRAGLLLDSWTLAPSVGPVNVMVPVAGLAPVSVFGTTDTADSDGPAGRAGLTDRLAERGVFPTHAVIWTIVGGAAAFVEIGNVADCDPAGTTTDDGTVATDVSPLKSSTFVASGSGNASVTVPVAVAPSRTCDGSTESAEMLPAARAPVGSASMAAVAARAIDSAKRRMETSLGGRRPCRGGGGGGDRSGSPGPGSSYGEGLSVDAPLALRRCGRGGPDVLAEPGVHRRARRPRGARVLERRVGRDAVRGGGQAASGDERLGAQQRDAGVVARIAARRRLERLAERLDADGARRVERPLERRAARVIGDGVAESRELVRVHHVKARAGEQSGRGDLRVEHRLVVRAVEDQPVRARLVRRLVGREAHVAVLAEHLDLAAELARELVEHGLKRAPHVALVRVAMGLEPRPRVVGLEALEPRERRGREAGERAQRSAPSSRSTRRRIASDAAYVESIP